MARREEAKARQMLLGTLDMLILRTLITGPVHGHTIAHAIERTSEEVLQVEQGSLYPALHRLEDRGRVVSYWGISENNRKAKYYKLTAAGRNANALTRSRIHAGCHVSDGDRYRRQYGHVHRRGIGLAKALAVQRTAAAGDALRTDDKRQFSIHIQCGCWRSVSALAA